jgi:hypothetical protein
MGAIGRLGADRGFCGRGFADEFLCRTKFNVAMGLCLTGGALICGVLDQVECAQDHRAFNSPARAVMRVGG